MSTTYSRETVTEDNVADIREAIVALDQRAEIAVGQIISTWPIRGGCITVWHRTGRAACATGGNSVWGDWDETRQVIVTDDGEYEIDDDGTEYAVAERDAT